MGFDPIGDDELFPLVTRGLSERRPKAKEEFRLKPTPRGIAEEVLSEVETALEEWPSFNSAHEGFAVLKEEVDELWEQVKVNQKRRDLAAMRKEAVQVAAMAIRFVYDVCNETTGRK